MQKHANRSILISLYKAHVQVDKGPTHKTRHVEAYRGESGSELELMGTGGNFLNRKLMALKELESTNGAS